MNRKWTVLGIAASCTLSVSLAAQTPGASGQANPPTEEKPAQPASPEKMSATRPAHAGDLSGFARKAAAGGMAEVELGRLATQKASSDKVKQFGQRMVDDHSKANDELKQVASTAGIELPSEIDSKSKATIEKLSRLSGAEFDKAYMADMVRDHEHDVAEFARAAKHADSPVGSFAGKTLPTLREHLKMARDVEKEVGGERSSPAS
jgi:putative membrane protein